MNAKQGLNLRDFTATGINKEDEVYKVLFSDDEGNGALAAELDKALEFINYYTKTDDVRNHKGYTLEMIIKEFTAFRRMMFEPDENYLRRFLAVTERKKDETWGTKWNIQHVFEAYFKNVKVYVAETTDDIDRNLLKNGDFESNEEWETGGEAAYNSDARFSGKRGLYFNGMPGRCEQKVGKEHEHLQSGVYTLHFFMEGKCSVRIRNSQGRYWNATAEPNNYVLAWQDEECFNLFEGSSWKDVFCFIVLPEEDDLTIEFLARGAENCKIDHVRLFRKLLNSSYTVIVQFEGWQVTEKSLHLAKGKDDPIEGVDYSKESYFDHSFIVGRYGAHRREVFNSLLNIVRPKGIQPFLEFIEKEHVEGH